jgi:hypothetical protein
MSVAHLTQWVLHVLPISNLHNSRVLSCLLVYPSIVLLASCFAFFGTGLPSVGGIFQLTCCCCTKVSKSRVCMTNNYSRDCGSMALLSPWPLALQILSFSIGRVRVGEIEKKELGEVKGQHAIVAKYVEGEKYNPTKGG